MNQTALVMYYIKDSRKEKQVIKLCRELQLRTRKIKSGDVNCTLGAMTGISGMPLKTGKKAPAGYELPELLVFSGMADKKLDEFLAEYRALGIEPISLKAIITPQNVTWSLYELTTELIRERASILMGNK